MLKAEPLFRLPSNEPWRVRAGIAPTDEAVKDWTAQAPQAQARNVSSDSVLSHTEGRWNPTKRQIADLEIRFPL